MWKNPRNSNKFVYTDNGKSIVIIAIQIHKSKLGWLVFTPFQQVLRSLLSIKLGTYISRAEKSSLTDTFPIYKYRNKCPQEEPSSYEKMMIKINNAQSRHWVRFNNSLKQHLLFLQEEFRDDKKLLQERKRERERQRMNQTVVENQQRY